MAQWKSHPVTKLLNEAIQERIEDAKEQLVASSNYEFDQFVRGMIKAFRDVLEADVKPTIEGVDDEIQA